MSEMTEKVALAIDAVRFFSRFNDWTSDRVDGLPVEICRYGAEGEDEIVVVARYRRDVPEYEALETEVSKARARAAIEAMREPTDAMEDHAFATVRADSDNMQCPEFYRAMIDAALE